GLPPVRHLIVLPSNEMAGIPVEALSDQFKISYVPSGTVFAWLQEQREKVESQEGNTSLLALGNPNFQRPESDNEKSVSAGQRAAPFAPLPATRLELQAISRLFTRVNLLTNSEASEQNLNRLSESGELANFRYLHFATHGLLDDRRALNSALILAQDRLPD